jgi:hypothetical protein
VSDEEREGASWVQVTAAALAAMSSAVILSSLGVAGTIIGAAVGSLTASVGGALYSRGIHASRDQAVALKRVAQARLDVDAARAAMRRGEAGSDTTLRQADLALGEAEEALQHADEEPGGSSADAPETGHSVTSDTEAGGAAGDERAVYGVTAEPAGADDEDEESRRLPWKRIALITVGVFVAAMVAITAFELATGRAVSTYTGGTDSDKGTTVPGLGGGGDPAPEEEPEEQPTSVPTDQPSEAPSSEPTTEPTDGSEPSPVPSELPSETATPTPTPTLTATPTETAPTEDGSS